MATLVEVIKGRRFFYGWWIAAVAFLALFVSAGSSAWAFSIIIKPMSTELSWSRSQIFLVVTIAGILGGLTSPFIGRLVDRQGARVSIVACSIISGLLLIICSQVTSFWLFLLAFGVGRGIVGPGMGMVGPNAAVANWFVKKRGRAFAMLSTGSPISGMIFPPLITWIIAMSNWRMAWIALGVLTIILVAPMAWFFVRRRPEDIGLKPDGEDPDRAIAQSSPIRPQPRSPGYEFTAKEALKTKTFWLMTIAFALTGVPAGTIFLHMPLYYTDHGIDVATVAGLMSLYAFGAFTARGIWGYVSERFAIHYLLISHALLYGFAITIFLLVGTSSLLLMYLPIILLGIAAGGGMQLDNQAWADYYGRREIGSIMGYWSFFRTGFSSAGPLFAAAMVDVLKSYTVPFGIFALFCVIASAILIFAEPPKKSAAEAIT